MLDKLPPGWAMTTLGEIVRPRRVRVLPRQHKELPYIGLEHIESQSMRLLNKGKAMNVLSSSFLFERGDVLYGKMRPYLNKVWVAEFAGVCSAEFLVFPHSNTLNASYLALRLNADDFVKFANQQVSGERPRVDFQGLSQFPIHLPPLAEQKRIVATLSESLTRMHSSVLAVQRGSERLAKYRRAVLYSAVCGELTQKWRKTQSGGETGAQLLQQLLKARQAHWEQSELARYTETSKKITDSVLKSRYRHAVEADTANVPEIPRDWTWVSVDQIAAHQPRSVIDGPFGSNLKSSHYTKSGPRVIRLQNIGDGVFVDQKSHISQEHYNSLKDYAVDEGDLVIRALGIPAPRACRIPNIGPAIVKADCVRLKVASDFIVSDYVLLALNSPQTQYRTEKKIHGLGRPRLNLSEIKSIALPLPPFDEQKQIVNEVRHRLTAADRLSATLDGQLERSQVARQSLLRKSFTGELVAQNPHDEPASDLLARIHTNIQAQPSGSEKSRMKKSKASPVQRPLIEVLREHNEPISPEQLFKEAGFEPALAHLFYRELASLRNLLRETKPSGSEATMWPHGSHVLLVLKEK